MDWLRKRSPAPRQILERHGRELRSRLREQMLGLAGSPFVHLGRYWSLSSLLAEVHVGHLNIAEAAIDMRGAPLATSDILPELGLPREMPPALAAFLGRPRPVGGSALRRCGH